MAETNYLTVSHSQLEIIISALRMPSHGATNSRSAIRQFETIAEEGWSAGWRLADLMLLLDKRISLTHLCCPDDFAEQMKLDQRFAFRQGQDFDEGPTGYMMYSSATVACLLIWLERLGFDVDPSDLCNEIAKRIGPNRFVNEDEIEVLGYPDKRHQSAPVQLAVEEAAYPSPSGETLKFDTGSGYHVVVRHNSQNAPIMLEVHAPLYVEPRPQMLIECSECKFNFVSGIRSDEHTHNIEHRKVVTTLKPIPSRALRKVLSSDVEAVWVTTDSPSWLRIAVYRRALAFKREMKFDFAQWEVGYDPDAVGFLFHDEDFRITGACCFRSETEDKPHRTSLDWIWICPDQRRSGLLSKNWNRFHKRFGDFSIAHPLSDAMQGFLRKQGGAHLLG